MLPQGKKIKHKKKFFLKYFPLLFLVLAMNSGDAGENYLLSAKIQDGNIVREILRLKTRPRSILTIGYDHSLYQTPQKEIYIIEEGRFILKEINFGKLEAAYYYDAYYSDKFFKEGNLWKFLPGKLYSLQVLKIRIPSCGFFFMKLDDSFIWLPKVNDQKNLMILTIEP